MSQQSDSNQSKERKLANEQPNNIFKLSEQAELVKKLVSQASHSTNQPTNKPSNQSSNRPTIQRTNQTASQPANQQTNRGADLPNYNTEDYDAPALAN